MPPSQQGRPQMRFVTDPFAKDPEKNFRPPFATYANFCSALRGEKDTFQHYLSRLDTICRRRQFILFCVLQPSAQIWRLKAESLHVYVNKKKDYCGHRDHRSHPDLFLHRGLWYIGNRLKPVKGWPLKAKSGFILVINRYGDRESMVC